MDTRYTQSHEWISASEGIATIGITENAMDLLGDIVHIDFPKPGSEIAKNNELCTLDSIKSAIEIYSPLSGVIMGINRELEQEIKHKGKITSLSPWIVKVKIQNPEEISSLMNTNEYEEYLRSIYTKKTELLARHERRSVQKST